MTLTRKKSISAEVSMILPGCSERYNDSTTSTRLCFIPNSSSSLLFPLSLIPPLQAVDGGGGSHVHMSPLDPS